MQISGLSPVGIIGYVRTRHDSSAERLEATLDQQTRQHDIDRLRDLVRYVSNLRKGLGETQKSFRAVISRLGKASRVERIASSQPLGLDQTESATRIASTEEINTISTSFTPFGPSFTGQSTTLPTVGGVYDGSNGDQVLTFKARRNRTVGGSRKLELDVLDENDKRIDRVRFERFDPPGTTVTLDNGLTLSLSAGKVRRNDTFQVQVSASVGSAVDPSKPFNGTRNDQPNFEPGLSVSAGSFEINGEEILVGTHDSINNVVNKINQSNAGVLASFEAGSERVVIEHQTLGSAPQISLTNDTSGFLAATKLDSAIAIRGKDRDSSVAMSSLSVLGRIDAGEFQIDETVLNVDPNTDSLEDLIDRVNANLAHLTAGYSSELDVFEFVPGGRRLSLRLEDRTSGLFSGLGIQPQVYNLTEGKSTLSSRVRMTATDELSRLARSSHEMPQDASTTSEIQEKLFAIVTKELSSKQQVRETEEGLEIAGIQFNKAGSHGLVSFDEAQVAAALRRNDNTLRQVFVDRPSGNDRASLFSQLMSELEGVERELRMELHQRGSRYIDILA